MTIDAANMAIPNIRSSLEVAGAAQGGAGRDRLQQDDFLKLMTAQMANQDPFKPLDSGDFMTQIAQFGSVQGIQDLQKSFSEFANAMVPNQALQSASLVGRKVYVPTAAGQLNAQGLGGAVELPVSSPEVTVKIYNGAGELVKTLALGAKQGGLVDYRWDGTTDAGNPAPPGNYKIRAEALISGSNTGLDHFAEATVDSVTMGTATTPPLLNLAGLGSVGLYQVRAIR